MSRLNTSIVIPLFNQVAYTRLCVEYLFRYTCLPGVEFILVDNGSTDGTGEYLASLAGAVRIIRNPENLGFAKACNQGAQAAAGRHVVFLNNDTVPRKGWLQGLIDPFGMNPKIGIVGSKLIYPDGNVQQAGIVFSEKGVPYHLYTGFPEDHPAANKPRFFRAVTGACLAVDRGLFMEAGGFDERYVNGLEDIDLCLKVGRLGRSVFYNPASVIVHFESRSERRQERMAGNLRLFNSLWPVELGFHDDYKYFSGDGTGLWCEPTAAIAFANAEEIRENSKLKLAEAEAHIRKGKMEAALSCYRYLVYMSPYRPEVLECLVALTLKMGLADVAASFREKIRNLTIGLENYGREPLPPDPPPHPGIGGEPSLDGSGPNPDARIQK